MNRVMIIGCCGSGKSTLSRNLHQISGIPLFHLDQYYWKANWVETPKSEWTKIVKFLADKKDWIIDGNYGGTLDIRLQNADTVVYLDYPTWRSFGRVIKRILKYRGIVRPDMVEGCPERFDLNFLHYVLVFNLIRRKSLIQKINSYKDKLNVVVLKNDKQVKAYLSALTAK